MGRPRYDAETLMKKFRSTYGKCPSYPVADAGCGSYSNYLFCEANDIEKNMKFTMFGKETKDVKYKNNSYRAVNFRQDENWNLLCPEGRNLEHYRDRPIKGNRYGKTEEIYKCKSCEGGPKKTKCSNGTENRTIRMNAELTKIHDEVISNLKSVLGVTLRTNCSIQAERAFGLIKWNRSYKRAQRRGIESIIFEFTLISIGFNIYKHHNKKHRASKVT